MRPSLFGLLLLVFVPIPRPDPANRPAEEVVERYANGTLRAVHHVRRGPDGTFVEHGSYR
ncbi:MAG: hypothetical protein AB1726_14785 [Planctomycetota bacterium]